MINKLKIKRFKNGWLLSFDYLMTRIRTVESISPIVLKTIERFRENGSVKSRSKSGRPSSVTTEEQ